MAALINKQTSAYGNPQLNIRLPRDVMEKIEKAKDAENLPSSQELARRVILAALGEDLPSAISRSEFSQATEAIADLTSRLEALQDEVETLKKSEPLD